MNMRDKFEDPPPCVAPFDIVADPRVPVGCVALVTPATKERAAHGVMLRFAGGPVDTAGMRASGPTRTTLSTDTMILELRDAIAFLEDAKRLDEQGRSDEGDFERRMAERHIRNALLWCEP